MKKTLLALILSSWFLGCVADPPAQPANEHRSPRCEQWRAENGHWYTAHEITEDSYYSYGPCPCGMTTKDGHLYINGVLSDDAQESPGEVAPVSTQ